MLRVEFHCHTVYSKDSLTSPRVLLETCRRKGVDRVVVTDHNTIAGARAAQLMEPDRVIIGEEIMTTAGELLAAFVSEEIPSGLSPRETIGRLRQQQAFISVSHPFDASRKGGWALDQLLEISPLVDAIEVFNSRCMSPSSNDRALAFARQHDLPATVGSDAHTTFELGRSVLLLEPFADAAQLRMVIRRGLPQTRWSPPWIHLTSRYARFRKWFGYGLDTARRT
jgi:predicted metal-dependent phosphoesterase TrpH